MNLIYTPSIFNVIFTIIFSSPRHNYHDATMRVRPDIYNVADEGIMVKRKNKGANKCMSLNCDTKISTSFRNFVRKKSPQA